jgi:hypothetical protein
MLLKIDLFMYSIGVKETNNYKKIWSSTVLPPKGTQGDKLCVDLIDTFLIK